MSKIIRQERFDRLERCLRKIELGQSIKQSEEDQIYKLVDLYIAYLRVQEKNWPYLSEDGPDLFNLRAVENLISFIKLDPFITRIKAAITALLNNDVQRALEILQKIIDEKNKIVSEMQRKNRTGANQPSDYNELLKSIYKKNPEIAAKDMLKELKKEIGKGVITRIDSNLDEIVTKDGSTYSINGLKDYIYRFRKSEV
jgi:hypothetical protein